MNEIFEDLPCIKTSCLKFPICKIKEIIYCHELAVWINSNEIGVETMKEMFSTLQNVVSPSDTEGTRLFAYPTEFKTIPGWWQVVNL